MRTVRVQHVLPIAALPLVFICVGCCSCCCSLQRPTLKVQPKHEIIYSAKQKNKNELVAYQHTKKKIKIFSKFILKTNEQINKNKIRTKQKREIIDRPAHLYCVVVSSIYLYFYIFSSRAKRSILVCRLQSMQPQHVFNACFCCCAFAVCTYTYVCVYIGVITADWLFVANFFGGQFSGILVSKNCIKQRGERREEKRKNSKNVVDKNAVAIKFH